MIVFSNSDVHAVNTGPANPGSHGVDCESAYTKCTDKGSKIESSNRFNTTDPSGFSKLGDNNGVQGGIDLSGLTTEMQSLRTLIDNLLPTQSAIDLTSSGG